MKKRLVCIVFCVLMAVLPLFALADGLSDAEVFGIFFPGQQPQPTDDFYCTFPGYTDPAGRFTSQDAFKVAEVRSMGGQYVAVLSVQTQVHAGGYCNFLFGVIDPNSMSLVGTPLYLCGDSGEYYLMYREGQLGLLYVGGYMGMGMESHNGGRWDWNGQSFVQTWPSQADNYDYWSNRKLEISYPMPNGFTVYRSIPVEDSVPETFSNFAWQHEGWIDANGLGYY